MAGPWDYDLLLKLASTSHQITGTANIVFTADGTISGGWSLKASEITGLTYSDSSAEAGVIYKYKIIDSLGEEAISGNVMIPSPEIHLIEGYSNIVFGSLGTIIKAAFKAMTGTSNIIFDSLGSITITTNNEYDIVGLGNIVFDSNGSIGRRLSFTGSGTIVLSSSGRIYKIGDNILWLIKHSSRPYSEIAFKDTSNNPLNCNTYNVRMLGSHILTGDNIIDTIIGNINSPAIWKDRSQGLAQYQWKSKREMLRYQDNLIYSFIFS